MYYLCINVTSDKDNMCIMFGEYILLTLHSYKL